MAIRKSREKVIQREVCKYLKIKYSNLDLLIFSDLAGSNLSVTQRSEYENRSNDSFPDLMIFYPQNGYLGLFIELKKEGFKTHKKNGELVANKHIRKQAKTIERLCSKGYFACFGIGLSETIEIIDNYFKNNNL